MTILVIDNYDSFTYNLVQLIHHAKSSEVEIMVKRNDALSCDEIASLAPTHIIISPGPGTPRESGISPEVVRTFYRSIPILGVCLGHQVICDLFGASVSPASYPVHGKQSRIRHTGTAGFETIPSPISVGRYHSLVAREIPEDTLEITAVTEDGIVMAVAHRDAPLRGVQFHPESFLTEHGTTIMRNFLAL